MFSKIVKNLKKRWKIILVLLLILAGVWGYSFYRSNQEQPELTFVSPERGNLTKNLEVSGEISAKQFARMRFISGGKIVYIGAQVGDRVKKWQTLATIDQRTLQKALERDLNEYSKERLDWDQTLDNTKDRTIPTSEDRTKQKEQYDLNNSVIDVEAASIAISNTALTAPFDGVLINAPTNVTGVTVLATDTFDVINPDSLIFRAMIDEVDIAQAKIGQQAIIKLDAYPDEEYQTVVHYISYQSAETTTGTVFPVEFQMLGERNIEKFRLGMNGDATIILETKEDTLSIPLDSTIERDGKTFVMVKTGEETTEEREIQIGIETEDRIEVLSGLTESDLVVLPE